MRVWTWVLDLKGRGIRVNAISPGTPVTLGLDGLAGPGADLKGFYDYLGGLVPPGRRSPMWGRSLRPIRPTVSAVPISSLTAASHRSETHHRILLSGDLQ